MPFTAPADMAQTFSRRSTVEFHRRPLLPQLTQDRSMEVNSAYRVQISNPSYSKPSDATRKKAYDRTDDDWPTGAQAEAEFISLDVDQRIQDARDLLYLDNIELPLNYLERIRADMAASMATDYEDEYYDWLKGLNYGASPAGRQDDIGGGSNKLDHQGVLTGSVGDLIYDAIQDFNVYLTNLNAIGPSSGPTIGGAAGMPYCAMNAEVFKQFARWLLDKRLSFDTLTEGILRRNTILSSGNFRGMIAGIPIFTTPAIDKPTSSAAAQKWILQMGTTEANATARRTPITQFLTPTVNQDKYRYELKQVWFYGRAEVNSKLNYRARLATA